MSIFYSDIVQLKDVVRTIKSKVFYNGKDENGEPVYITDRKLPAIHFHGQVKLHGTNAGVMFKDNKVIALSRSKILTPEDDNYGFASYVKSQEDQFRSLFNKIEYDADLYDETVIILYGEWAGKGIQKNVAISQLEEKTFFVFDCKIEFEEYEHEYANKAYLSKNSFDIIPDRTKFLEDYQTFDIIIDFENPFDSIIEITRLVESVEQECPVGKAFGYSSVGEGIVWTGYYNGERITFKTKGEKHSVVKTKDVVTFTPEQFNSIIEFTNYSCTENRMNQMLTKMKDNSIEISKKNVGTFLKYINEDILKEESDTINELIENINIKKSDVMKNINYHAKKFYFDVIDNEL